MRSISRNKTKILVATLLLVIFALAISVTNPVMSPILSNRTISNSGSITAIGVGVYWDQEGSMDVSGIDWGTLEPGSNKTVAVYIRNEGSSPANLTMFTSNWNPPNATDYVVLSWDREGYQVAVGEVVQATFTLSVSAAIQGITTFSFDITILAIT